MAWYDLDNYNGDKKSYLKKIKYDHVIMKKAKSFNHIIDEDIEPNVQYRIITENGFNAITVIQSLSEKYEIEEIYIAVYRMNQNSVKKLLEFINDDNIYCGIILSSFFRNNKNYEKWAKDLVAYSLNRENTDIAFIWSHAKVFLAKTKCGKHIVFEGSGNLSDNARIEQYLLEDRIEAYHFHKNWISEYLKNE